MSALLEIDGLEQRLRDAERPEEFVVRVPQRLSIAAGDFVAILGPSGCGKTTLLSVLGLLRAPTNAAGLNAFRMCVRDGAKSESVDLAHLWKRRAHSAIERVRRRCIGFALQSGELLPALTVRENIEAPLCLNGWPATKRKSRVDYLISAFQLRRQTAERDRPLRNGSSSTYDLAMARVNKLSGGEYQRVSLARAIAHQPQVIFIDEPTAALNRELARGALQEFRNQLSGSGSQSAAVMITHDEDLADEFANVVVRMAPLRDEPGGAVTHISRNGP